MIGVALNERAQVQASIAPYTKPFLLIYDFWVVRLSNSLAWRCGASKLLAMYDANVAGRHLEVGPGSGWYLAHATFPVGSPEVTLMDLNLNTLAFTEHRLAGKARVTTVRGSVLEPIPVEAGNGYGSIGVNYVMHCVPGDWAEKGAAFAHLAQVLSADGVLFGSTILGQNGARRNVFGSALMETYNHIGAFNNRDDDKSGLDMALRGAFDDVELVDHGEVTMFTARAPIRKTGS